MPRMKIKSAGLPSRVYLKHGAYYFVDIQKKWHRLAKEGDKKGLFKALSALMGEGELSGMALLFDRYEQEVLPTKSKKTQIEQVMQIKTLRRVFGHMHPAQILPVHIAKYLDKKSAKSMGNREIALLSHVFRKAIRWGDAVTNPCVGVERNKESPRDRYVTDDEFRAVYSQAPDLMQVFMDLAYLTGQRQADLIQIKITDLGDDGIFFQQQKTKAKIIVAWSDALRATVERARALQTEVKSLHYLIATKDGQPYRSSGIQTAWQRLIAKCFKDGTIKERFTFHDLRAKARSDGEDKRLLGHANPEKMAKTYQRKPTIVLPVK